MTYYYPFKTARDTSDSPMEEVALTLQAIRGWVIIFIMIHKCIINL